mmetsp:Transcript_18949/g.52901  ORF Transcript_18949/g.52901 Transcript_18949/m.52901 type:complete len:236 (-) Transcript_18949:975-1682(-)
MQLFLLTSGLERLNFLHQLVLGLVFPVQLLAVCLYKFRVRNVLFRQFPPQLQGVVVGARAGVFPILHLVVYDRQLLLVGAFDKLHVLQEGLVELRPLVDVVPPLEAAEWHAARRHEQRPSVPLVGRGVVDGGGGPLAGAEQGAVAAHPRDVLLGRNRNGGVGEQKQHQNQSDNHVHRVVKSVHQDQSHVPAHDGQKKGAHHKSQEEPATRPKVRGAIPEEIEEAQREYRANVGVA